MNITLSKLFRAIAASAMLIAGSGLAHGQDTPTWWRPNQYFVQAGAAEDATALTVGAIWYSDWASLYSGGLLRLYWEVSFGRWSADQPDGSTRSAWVTQVGITPVLRWYLGANSTRWFVEAGIGGNLLLPIYRSRDKRFSTTFNFGDHIGVGMPFGEGERQEIALRIQHFSNAGIRHPNPGENFVQLRYTARF